MNEKDLVRLHATIHGRVQGVGFRYFVLECAQRIGVVGWTRNRFNGTVEVLAEGAQAQLDNLIKDLQRGSRSSNVTQVKTDFLPATGEFTQFTIRRTG